MKINKYKYPILTIVLVCTILSSFMLFRKPKYSLSKLESKGIISYTIDGTSATEKPSKSSGYVVNTITCANGSNLVWDNDNWLVEIVSLESYDNCLIDFTKDLSKSGTRVTLIKGDSTEITENFKDEVTFEYNGTDGSDGSVQTFTAPATGDYTLEAWGGQGGNGYISASSTLAGAYGGYSKGTVSLNAGDILYIYVGGKGQDGDSTTTAKTGGYNGGGSTSASSKGGAGGGATHIATTEGLLSTLSSSTANILLVAGGGGGSAGYSGYKGGNGGGTTGTAGTGYNTSNAAKGGSQSSGGAAGGYTTTSTKGSAGTFGKGGNSSTNTTYAYSGAGGSGYYGGGGGGYRNSSKSYFHGTSGGGGGSGFVNTSLTDASTSTQTEYTGNGKAIISYDITKKKTIVPSSAIKVLDSSNKTTTSGGIVTFYLNENAKLFKLENCPNGNIVDDKVIIKNVLDNVTCTIIGTSLSTDILQGSLAAQILKDNPTVSERTDFSVTNTTNTTGTIFKQSSSLSSQMTEDTNGDDIGETTYYYSGATTNNWVKFGKYNTDDSSSNSLWNSGDDMYWRIIRINEDGSVRLLYSGNATNTTNGYATRSTFNSSRKNSSNIGYMYGTTSSSFKTDTGSLANIRLNTNSSQIKQAIDTWYENNMLTNYDKYISKTAIYCNDRSIGKGTYSDDSGEMHFGAWTRLYTNKAPTYKCGGNGTGGLFESTQAIEDKFSASTTGGGNGQLTYPVALMTADEAAYAGGVYATQMSIPNTWYNMNSENNYIIPTGSSWYHLTPAHSSDDNGAQYGFVIYAFYTFGVYSGSSGGGTLASSFVTDNKIVRPVISLKACTKYSSGDGTANNPYTVTIDEECASAEN